MFKIETNDADRTERFRTFRSGFTDRESAVKAMCDRAKLVAGLTPHRENGAIVDQTGPDEVSVLLGVYKLSTFRVLKQ